MWKNVRSSLIVNSEKSDGPGLSTTKSVASTFANCLVRPSPSLHLFIFGQCRFKLNGSKSQLSYCDCYKKFVHKLTSEFRRSSLEWANLRILWNQLNLLGKLLNSVSRNSTMDLGNLFVHRPSPSTEEVHWSLLYSFIHNESRKLKLNQRNATA